MFRRKKVILSYDYELFFGDKSGTVQKSLIEPTNKILEAMESVGFHGNFFVDWQMLKYLNEENTERTISDYNLIVTQLKDIVRRGHRIELHIHPHWVDAKYNGDGTWDFSEFRHYSLNSFSEDEIINMFVEGTNLLESIAKDVDPQYKIIAFRAGGWAVQPFDKLKQAFVKVGIKIDSSVMCNAFAVYGDSQFDFRGAPRNKRGLYRFEDNVCVENELGSFLEVPISNVSQTFVFKVLRRLSSLFWGIPYCITDGSHVRAANTERGDTNLNKMISLTFSFVNPFLICFNQIRVGSGICCYIDHPKDFTGNTCLAIKALSKTCKKSMSYYELIK